MSLSTYMLSLAGSSKWDFVLKTTPIVFIIQVFLLLLLTSIYLKYILILVVSIHTYGIVSVHVVHVRDFIDVL